MHSAAATVPTHALCVLKKSVTEFMWNGADSNRRRPMVDGTTLAQPHVNGGVNYPLVKAHWRSQKSGFVDMCAVQNRTLGRCIDEASDG